MGCPKCSRDPSIPATALVPVNEQENRKVCPRKGQGKPLLDVLVLGRGEQTGKTRQRRRATVNQEEEETKAKEEAVTAKVRDRESWDSC